MDYVKRVQKEMRRLEKARDKAQAKGDAILANILKQLCKSDPGWVLKPTGQDEVIFFMNGSECISLNLETGQVDPLCILSDVGKKGLTVLIDEAGKKMDSWVKVLKDFQSKRVLLLERVRGLERAMEGYRIA